MELEIYISGIGGQGIQLMARVLALAALAEDRHVQLSAEYGFTMRGGSSLATLVVGIEPIRALPVVASAGAAILLHHNQVDGPVARLRPGALVVSEEQISGLLPPMAWCEVVPIPAGQAAREIGAPMAAGLTLLAAFNSIAGLVATESLVSAMKQCIPSYRQQHIATNADAIWAGAKLPTLRRPLLGAATGAGLAA